MHPTMVFVRWLSLSALFAVAALVLLLGGVPPARAASPASVDRSLRRELPDSVGRQLHWLIGASRRLPLGEAELRAHFTRAFWASPGASPAETNRTLLDTGGMRLVRLTVVKRNSLVAIVSGHKARRFVLVFVVDRSGLIGFARINPANAGRRVALPQPSGPAAVGTDVVQLVDRTRGGRRLMLSRWYPAAPGAQTRPLAAYASPLMSAALGLPPVAGHARRHARARHGRLPVVLFSPGLGVSRLIYQGLAEDLASHGYLVVAVDHTGEVPVEFADGSVGLRTVPTPKTRIPDLQATRVRDMQLILRRLNAMPQGPLPDLHRIAAVGHSLGGSTAAALMRLEPSVRAGVDLDGSIVGAAAKRGVPRAFLVLAAGAGANAGSDPSIRSLLKHSRGPRLLLQVAGFEHLSFSDLPVLAPGATGVGKRASARDLVLQAAYVRAFVDRYLRNRPSRLLDGPSNRFPRVSFTHRGR